MIYIYNPKFEGSNIVGCVPQKTKCPFKCKDCFAYRPGAYLGENGEHCPNIPSLKEVKGKIVRMNDIHDSACDRELVKDVAYRFSDKFFNTSQPYRLEDYKWPVVLTANPGAMTDDDFWIVEPIPTNVMFVRARVNSWNLENVDRIVKFYNDRGVPVVLTFMAYYETPIPDDHKGFYEFKQRTLNSYWCLLKHKWYNIRDRYTYNDLVFTCGAAPNKHLCKDCRNCELFYWETKERCKLS